jgi:hypothetical protein
MHWIVKQFGIYSQWLIRGSWSVRLRLGRTLLDRMQVPRGTYFSNCILQE